MRHELQRSYVERGFGVDASRLSRLAEVSRLKPSSTYVFPFYAKKLQDAQIDRGTRIDLRRLSAESVQMR